MSVLHLIFRQLHFLRRFRPFESSDKRYRVQHDSWMRCELFRRCMQQVEFHKYPSYINNTSVKSVVFHTLS